MTLMELWELIPTLNIWWPIGYLLVGAFLGGMIGHPTVAAFILWVLLWPIMFVYAIGQWVWREFT